MSDNTGLRFTNATFNRYPHDAEAIERAASAERGMVATSLDMIIEAEEGHNKAMIRLADHYRSRQKRDGKMMLRIGVGSWLAGAATCWAFLKLGGFMP